MYVARTPLVMNANSGPASSVGAAGCGEDSDEELPPLVSGDGLVEHVVEVPSDEVLTN